MIILSSKKEKVKGNDAAVLAAMTIKALNEEVKKLREENEKLRKMLGGNYEQNFHST